MSIPIFHEAPLRLPISRNLTFGVGAVLAWAALDVASVHAAPSFRLLDLPVGDSGTVTTYSAVARGSSFDDPVVVGSLYSESLGQRTAFRWNESDGLQLLAPLPVRYRDAGAAATSSDGSMIVGSGRVEFESEAFVWSPAFTDEPFEAIPFLISSAASTVSGDGHAVFGMAIGAPGVVPFRWTAAEGPRLIEAGWGPSVEVNGRFRSSSHDGSVAVGSFEVGDEGADSWPAVWTASAGFEYLGLPDGAYQGSAFDVSPDGRFVAGAAELRESRETKAMLWDREGGSSILAAPGSPASAYSVSNDGKVVAGFFRSGSKNRAALWLADDGYELKDLEVLLNAAGLDLDGFSPEVARFVSTDGRTVFGTGSDSTGNVRWFATVIPEPSTSVLLGLGLAALGLRAPRPG